MAPSDKHAKTEPATPKRRREARERGQVARSPDVFGWAAALVGSYIVPIAFGHAESSVLGVASSASAVMTSPSVAGALNVLDDGLRAALVTILPTAGSFMMLAIVTNYLQVGRGLSFKAARPKSSRISPTEGIKRLFSPATSVSLARQFAKLVVLGVVGYQTIHHIVHVVPSTIPLGIAQTIGLGVTSILGFVRTAALLGFLIGVADYGYQRHRLTAGLKMTKQEVRDEHRAQEGDTTMKAEMRKRQYMIARSRSIAAVRTADVVVANPTHFAVALQYQSGRGGAPRVVAKGSDLLAARIKQEAADLHIPVVEDPPLARYLYATCDVGEAIPTEIYVAVAKLLAFVYSLPEMVRGAVVHFHPPSEVPVDPGPETEAYAASDRFLERNLDRQSA